MHNKVIVVLFGALLIGCTHHQVREKPAQIVQPSMFWEDQAERRGFLADFSGKLALTYDGKKQRTSGKGRIVGRFPDSYRLELRDPIGRLQYVLTYKGELLAAQFPRNRQALRDPTGGRRYFQRMLGIGFSFGDLAGFFSGVVPLRWDKKKPSSWAWDPERGAYRGTFELGEEKLTLWVDSENLGISFAIWESGGEKVEAEYLAFEPCCEGLDGLKNIFKLASEVRVKIPSQQTSVEVGWTSMGKPSQDIPAAAFEFVPGSGDKVTDLK